MARAFKREGKKGATWYIEYSHQGRQHREKVGKEREGITKKIAEEALKSRLGDIAKGKFDLARTITYPLFKKSLAKYLETNPTNKKPESRRRDETGSKHLLRFFGNKRLNEITPFLIEKYKAKRKAELKAKYPRKQEKEINFASINRELSLLKHFFSIAEKWGNVDHNPVRGIKLFREKYRERYLERDEIESLIDACERTKNRDLKAIVITALNTGMRKKEILLLKRENLDFRNGIITLEDTKTGERAKVIMNDYLKEFLRGHLKSKPSKFEYVFCDSLGKPFSDIQNSFGAALANAGIENFRFHDLRHTFASQLIMQGVDSTTVQELGRWKTPSMLQRYAHLSPGHKKKAANVLGSLFTSEEREEKSSPKLAQFSNQTIRTEEVDVG